MLVEQTTTRIDQTSPVAPQPQITSDKRSVRQFKSSVDIRVRNFWRLTRRLGGDRCWRWRGAISGKGYPLHAGLPELGTTRAARLAYILTGHDLKPNECLPRLCQNRLCINPNHSLPATAHDVGLLGDGAAQRNARKTHCKRGHPLSGDNLKVERRQGMIVGRTCRLCEKAERARWYRRRAERRKIEARILNHQGAKVEL